MSNNKKPNTFVIPNPKDTNVHKPASPDTKPDVTPESGETIDTVHETTPEVVNEPEAIAEESQITEEESVAISEDTNVVEDVEDEIPVNLPFNAEEFEKIVPVATEVHEEKDAKVTVKKEPMKKVDNKDTFYLVLGHTNKEKILARIAKITTDVKENDENELYIGPYFSRADIQLLKRALAHCSLKAHLRFM